MRAAQIGIVWPTIALAALVYGIWLVMFVQRFRHMRANPPQPHDFASTESAGRYFQPVEMPANNLRNLFEMPVLYFALVPLLLIFAQANPLQVLLAWIYVALRAVHSLIHVGRNVVIVRFAVYLLSCAVLLAMWIGFAVDMIAAAGRLAAAGAI